jgi:hypothetical protein
MYQLFSMETAFKQAFQALNEQGAFVFTHLQRFKAVLADVLKGTDAKNSGVSGQN